MIQTEQTFANATNENSGVTPTFSLEEHAVEAIVRNILPMTLEFVRLSVAGIRWGNLRPRGELAYNKSTTKYWVTLQISEMEWKFWNKCWHNCCFITHGFRISSRKLGTDVRQLLWRILSQLAHFYKKLRDIVEHFNSCSDENNGFVVFFMVLCYDVMFVVSYTFNDMPNLLMVVKFEILI